MTSVTERVTDVSQMILLEMHQAWILLRTETQQTLILFDVLLAWSLCWRRLQHQNRIWRLPLCCRRGVSRLSINAGARMCCPIGEQHLIKYKRVMPKSSKQEFSDYCKCLENAVYLLILACYRSWMFHNMQQPATTAESEASADKSAAPDWCQSAFDRGGRCVVKRTRCSWWDPESDCGTQDDVCQFTQPWRQRESLAQWFWFVYSDFWFTVSNRRAW